MIDLQMIDLRLLAYKEVIGSLNFHSSAWQHPYCDQAVWDIKWWDYKWAAFKSSCDHHNIEFLGEGDPTDEYIIIVCDFCCDLEIVFDDQESRWLGWDMRLINEGLK